MDIQRIVQCVKPIHTPSAVCRSIHELALPTQILFLSPAIRTTGTYMSVDPALKFIPKKRVCCHCRELFYLLIKRAQAVCKERGGARTRESLWWSESWSYKQQLNTRSLGHYHTVLGKTSAVSSFRFSDRPGRRFLEIQISNSETHATWEMHTSFLYSERKDAVRWIISQQRYRTVIMILVINYVRTSIRINVGSAINNDNTNKIIRRT